MFITCSNFISAAPAEAAASASAAPATADRIANLIFVAPLRNDCASSRQGKRWNPAWTCRSYRPKLLKFLNGRKAPTLGRVLPDKFQGVISNAYDRDGCLVTILPRFHWLTIACRTTRDPRRHRSIHRCQP